MRFLHAIASVLLVLGLSLGALAVYAQTTTDQTADDLRGKIDAKNDEIAVLEQEIAKYQQQIIQTGNQKNTLQNALSSLELSRKKFLADIALTQKKIDSVNLTLATLTGQIKDKEGGIDVQQKALAESVRVTAGLENMSLLEAFLTFARLSDLWSAIMEAEELNGAIRNRVLVLTTAKNDLSNTKDETEGKKKELQALRGRLADQKAIVDDNRNQTNKLLKDTKDQESNYKKILADKQAKYKAAQQELDNYESQLKLLIDPNSFPAPEAVLAWPVDKPYVTQEFGDTVFARSHAQAYNGKGHNGIDLRASPGTPLKAALGGVVWGTGNTDTVCSGASYGKWVLIKHGNGLTTLYAHLSLIKVSEGQSISTGELIGYSGTTGYATGPHLHFSLYVTDGVQITNLKSKICGGTYRLPVADLRAYLNPLLYLPSI
jgi:murein DD-endopeptidase MepM/ murein hydrolase activator NlpD